MTVRQIIRERKARRKLWARRQQERTDYESRADVRLGRMADAPPMVMPEPLRTFLCATCRRKFTREALNLCPVCKGIVRLCD